MKKDHYLRSEQETVINWDNELPAATVYTFDQRIAGKLKTLASLYPDQFELLAKGPQRSVTYRVPKRCINIRPPYSESRRKQQREKAKERGFPFSEESHRRECSEGGRG